MLASLRFVACDLGAESGRVMLGTLCDNRLWLEQVHRFPHRQVRVLDSLHWDVLHLWEQLKHGLGLVAAKHSRQLAGIGVDTWGVDYVLLDWRGALLGLPYCYRDRRTETAIRDLSQHVSEWELYSQTGLGYSRISTLSQLLAMRSQRSPALEAASSLLMMGDLFHFWLSGRQATESTIAGTTQFLDLTTRAWAMSLLERLGLPASLPRQVVPTATVLGTLLPAVAEETGLAEVPVIAPACHDTAAAVVVAVPSRAEGHAFISSGTWSVIGTELDAPIITREALAAGFVNELGALGKVLFVHNSAGLWPLQECWREWHREGHQWSYADLTEMADRARAFAAIIDPDEPSLAGEGSMVEKIRAYCRRTGQEPPSGPGAITRGLLEGLALRYRKAVQDLDRITGARTTIIHMVGGGSRNRLLCQFTADATGQTVLAGPAEATAAGAVLLQALAVKSLASLDDLRAVAAQSLEPVVYLPRHPQGWGDAYAAFLRITRQKPAEEVSVG